MPINLKVLEYLLQRLGKIFGIVGGVSEAGQVNSPQGIGLRNKTINGYKPTAVGIEFPIMNGVPLFCDGYFSGFSGKLLLKRLS